jgi:hypothetical protein
MQQAGERRQSEDTLEQHGRRIGLHGGHGGPGSPNVPAAALSRAVRRAIYGGLMKKELCGMTLLVASVIAVPAHAGSLNIVNKCPPDAVLVGQTCMDKYEAGVWRVPPTTLSGVSNRGLIKKIQLGKATLADLTAGDATQLGTVSNPSYMPCNESAQNCANDIFAVSLAGGTPSAYITWFQAQEACVNSAKRLPSNAEWQAAADGTPDPGPDNGTTNCNTNSASAAVASGSRTLCVSSRGAYDMVGNVNEWVADWVPLSSGCSNWPPTYNDGQCLFGAETSGNHGPAALVRGGRFNEGAAAGPLYVNGIFEVQFSNSEVGFRCAR